MHVVRYILLFLSLPIFGQVSKEGRFSADYVKGCAPLTINLTEHDAFGNITRQYFYENQNNVTTNLTHTYNIPGTYNLVQLVGIDVDPKTDTLVIEVLPSPIPIYNYTFCDSREIQLEIDDPTYDSYLVTFANSAPVSLLDGESTNYTFGGTDPLSIDVQGVYSSAATNCATSSIILNQVFDNLVAPGITQVQLNQSCEDLFNLSLEADVETELLYRIEMSENGSSFTSIYEGLLVAPIVLKDVTLNENTTDYCVRVNAINACDGSLVTGNQHCISITADDFRPIQNLYSTYSGEQIQVNLESAQIGSFLFKRSYDQQSYSTLGQSNSSLTDSNPFQGRQYFYQVSYQDTCSAIWGQLGTRPPFIRATEITVNKYQVTFDPGEHHIENDFTFNSHLVGSENSEVTPVSSNTFEVNLSPLLGEKQVLQIVGMSNEFTIQSNTLSFSFEFVVHVPKAFTPNGDGLNDRLEFFGLDGSTAIMRIYTRWGQQVYGEISSAPAWDGLINGKAADEGIYVYEISIPELTNHVQKGTFALIKN